MYKSAIGIFLHGSPLLAFRLGGFCAPKGPIRPPQPLPLRKGRVLMLTQDAGGVDVFYQLNPLFGAAILGFCAGVGKCRCGEGG